MEEVVIVSAVRTAIGNFLGALKGISATELGAYVINEAIRRAGIGKEDVDEVIMGNVLPFGLGQNPARQAAIKAGLPWDVGCITVNKVCGSGLKAVMLAQQVIIAGDAEVIVAGEMENMTRAPYYLERAREGYRLWDGKLVDGMVHDGLWDVVNDFHMGYTAELVADKFGVSREEMDLFAFHSNRKAIEAIRNGTFKEEILPFWQGRAVEDRLRELLPPDVAEDMDKFIFTMMLEITYGIGHFTMDHAKVLKSGLRGIIEEAHRGHDRLSAEERSGEKGLFYEAVVRSLKAALRFARRYADRASSMAEAERDPVRREELEKIARVCRRVP